MFEVIPDCMFIRRAGAAIRWHDNEVAFVSEWVSHEVEIRVLAFLFLIMSVISHICGFQLLRPKIVGGLAERGSKHLPRLGLLRGLRIGKGVVAELQIAASQFVCHIRNIFLFILNIIVCSLE